MANGCTGTTHSPSNSTSSHSICICTTLRWIRTITGYAGIFSAVIAVLGPSLSPILLTGSYMMPSWLRAWPQAGFSGISRTFPCSTGQEACRALLLARTHSSTPPRRPTGRTCTPVTIRTTADPAAVPMVPHLTVPTAAPSSSSTSAATFLPVAGAERPHVFCARWP